MQRPAVTWLPALPGGGCRCHPRPRHPRCCRCNRLTQLRCQSCPYAASPAGLVAAMSSAAAGAQRLAAAVLRRVLLLDRPASVLHVPQLYLLSVQWCSCQLPRHCLLDGQQQSRHLQQGLGHLALWQLSGTLCYCWMLLLSQACCAHAGLQHARGQVLGSAARALAATAACAAALRLQQHLGPVNQLLEHRGPVQCTDSNVSAQSRR